MLSALGHCSLSSFSPLWELSAPPTNEAVCYVLTSGKQPPCWKALSILAGGKKKQTNFLRWDLCAELELLLLVNYHLVNVHQRWILLLGAGAVRPLCPLSAAGCIGAMHGVLIFMKFCTCVNICA